MATKGIAVFTHQGEDYTINDPNIANEFSTGTAYGKGDYCYYQGNLYRFTADHSAGAWNSNHVTQVTVANELEDRKAYEEDLKTELEGINETVEGINETGKKMGGYSVTIKGNGETPVRMSFELKAGKSYKVIMPSTTWGFEEESVMSRTLFGIGYLTDGTFETYNSMYERTLSDGSVNKEISIIVPVNYPKIGFILRASEGVTLNISIIEQNISYHSFEITGDGVNAVKTLLPFENGKMYKLIMQSTTWSIASGTASGVAMFEIGTCSDGTIDSWLTLYRKNVSDGAVDKNIIFYVPEDSKAVGVVYRAEAGTTIHVEYEKLDMDCNNEYTGTNPLIATIGAGYNMAVCDYLWAAGVKGGTDTPILDCRQEYNNTPAQSDISPITYEDSSPIIENNKLYYTMTCHAGSGGCGLHVFEYDIGTADLKLVGCVQAYVEASGNKTYFNATGNRIFYNRNNGKWVILTHGGDTYSFGGTHNILIGETISDPRFGVTSVKFASLDMENPTTGDEDALIFYDGDLTKWVLIYAHVYNGSYCIQIQKSDSYNGGFTYDSRITGVSATGIFTTKIGGVRYILTGNTKDNNKNRYSVYSYPEGTFVGNLNIDIDDGGYRGWNNLTPIVDGDKTKYILLAFDRLVTSSLHNWTYGDLYMYMSEEENNGIEFPVTINGHTFPANIEATYSVTQIHLKRVWSKRNAFNMSLLLGEISLESGIFLNDSNLYPSIGDSLKQFGNRVYLQSDGDGEIIGGHHKPYACYVMSVEEIYSDDIRYVSFIDEEENEIKTIGIDKDRKIYGGLFKSGNITQYGSLPIDTKEVYICPGYDKIYVFCKTMI